MPRRKITRIFGILPGIFRPPLVVIAYTDEYRIEVLISQHLLIFGIRGNSSELGGKCLRLPEQGLARLWEFDPAWQNSVDAVNARRRDIGAYPVYSDHAKRKQDLALEVRDLKNIYESLDHYFMISALPPAFSIFSRALFEKACAFIFRGV